MRLVWLFLFLLVFEGCEKTLFKDEPANTPTACFETFWNDFDRFYGQFDIRKVNWDSIYTVYRPKISSSTTEKELFKICDDLIQILKDGHVNLYSPIGTASYYNLFPLTYTGGWSTNTANYISFSSLQNGVIESGEVNSTNLAYIRIKTFYSNEFGNSDSKYSIIDEIIQQYNSKDGLIIDIRGNGGGNGTNAITVASRFADRRYLYFKQRYKSGPGKNDFSEWVNFYINKQGKLQYTKPVVVLMGKYTYSAAELFVSAMSVFPNVTLVGDTTGGGIGNPVYRELQNGWTYRLSTSIGAMANGHIIDGKGILPEVVIVPKPNNVKDNNKDIMLEKTIDILLKLK